MIWLANLYLLIINVHLLHFRCPLLNNWLIRHVWSYLLIIKTYWQIRLVHSLLLIIHSFWLIRLADFHLFIIHFYWLIWLPTCCRNIFIIISSWFYLIKHFNVWWNRCIANWTLFYTFQTSIADTIMTTWNNNIV